MNALHQRIVLARDDGSLGPLLRVADDRLAPGAAYGRHEHRAVDVVAVVVAGELRHDWGDGAVVRAGDVAVLRAGAGLAHDEVAGTDGARVLQCYLRSAASGVPAAHEVHRSPAGWVGLGRSDVRLWHVRLPAGRTAEVPSGLLLLAAEDGVVVTRQDGGPRTGPATALVWQLDTARPPWAGDWGQVGDR